MRLFPGLLGRRLPLAWEYTVRGVLWRLFPSAGGLLVGEDRDLENKNVTFFCLDARSGAPLWADRSFGEPWWMSVEALHGETLLLHEYAAPDMPDHKKILAVDARTGAVRWTNGDAKFLLARGETVYAARETYEERQFFAYRLADGAFDRQVTSEEMRELQRDGAPGSEDIVTFPSTAQEADAPDDLPAALAAARLRSVPALTEYIESPGFLALAVACAAEGTAEKPQFVQRLLLWDRARRRIVYDDVMHAALAMPVPDMFFARDGQVTYIRERRTLRAVRPGKEGNRG